jgi:hypothetical protein
MIHAILFSILALVTLAFLGSELKEVCKLEKGYMVVEEFETWGNDGEVTK